MRGAGQRRLPKRREEKIGVADEPRLTLSDAAVRDAPAGKGAAGSRQRFEAAGAEQTQSATRHVETLRRALTERRGAEHHAPMAQQRRQQAGDRRVRSEEHTSELQSLMRISYAVFCL